MTPDSAKKTQDNSFLYLLPMFLCLFILPFPMTAQGIEITISVALILFLATQYLIRRNARIKGVVTAYLDAYKLDARENGLARLLKCGVTELKNRWELNEVCRRIVAHGKPHPNYWRHISNAKLLAFLKFCHKNGHKLDSSSESVLLTALFQRSFPTNKK